MYKRLSLVALFVLALIGCSGDSNRAVEKEPVPAIPRLPELNKMQMSLL